MWEVIIVGAGPAGLSAALSLGRMRRKTLVIDAGEPRNATSPALHNFLSRDGTPPSELRAIARGQLRDYPTVQVRDARVESARAMDEDAFELVLSGGETLRTRRLLLATGVRDDLPPIPGLDALWGTGALHCPYCHGHEVADRPLAALGSNAHRMRMAIHLTRLSDDVALCTNGEPLGAPELRPQLEARGVQVREEAITRIDTLPDGGIRIVFSAGAPLERRAIFVQSVPRQRSPLAEQLGCAMLGDGTVEIDELFATSVPGVYAAGDMARRASMFGSPASVAPAAANGTMAGAMIDQNLVTRDFDLPDPFVR